VESFPMTYTTNGRHYVAMASGGHVLSFALQPKELP